MTSSEQFVISRKGSESGDAGAPHLVLTVNLPEESARQKIVDRVILGAVVGIVVAIVQFGFAWHLQKNEQDRRSLEAKRLAVQKLNTDILLDHRQAAAASIAAFYASVDAFRAHSPPGSDKVEQADIAWTKAADALQREVKRLPNDHHDVGAALEKVADAMRDAVIELGPLAVQYNKALAIADGDVAARVQAMNQAFREAMLAAPSSDGEARAD